MLIGEKEKELMKKYQVDLEKFWEDDELAHEDNCFSPESPQVALGIRMNERCVFAELDEPEIPWSESLPRKKQMELNQKYNDKAEKIVGRRLLRDEIPEKNPDAQFPRIKSFAEVFGGEHKVKGGTNWLESPCDTPDQLEKLLDKVKNLNLREYIFPENWESEKKRIYEKYGKKPAIMRGLRGPVTFATSIYGDSKLIFLINDNLQLARRFSRVIADTLFDYITILDEEAGYKNHEDAPRGFGFRDDNCTLLNPEMYEEFGYPILKKIFDHWCPDPEDKRYQHSDSAMAHLLPILSRFDLTGCNFGPTVLVDDIRKYMPDTRIDGCLSPITFMNNYEEQIIKEVKRDCRMAKKHGRGLNLSTAGSTENGSLLTSLRIVMHVIQRYGRY